MMIQEFNKSQLLDMRIYNNITKKNSIEIGGQILDLIIYVTFSEL